ncbi:hypothetical protein QEH52_19115 [Coraliomargarita sp. SDUM461003]|uniref:PEP-CTERM protein-sorting domain-containing protein n=1 Tax=Thalassobacterium maritimum TaxID=3041265 RepID=A0ABU1AZS3_9BACT|nr:hypothetical protein [Coraliomargarita sp. SDUM461003]MDQ8209638.1 hypothetical protein [Coraliomargarita sp. SDUM461003]
MNKKILPFLSLAPVLLASLSHAAEITWGSATNITGDSDVSTDGSLVVAASFNTDFASIVVNGVTFAGGGTNGDMRDSDTYGAALTYDVSNNSDAAYAEDVSPFNTLSSNYQNLLGSGLWDGTTSTTEEFTFGGLSIDQEYQIQIWAQDARSGREGQSLTITGAGGVSLDYTDRNTQGGLGQYVIGTFTADASTQSFTFDKDSSWHVNAMQVRSIPEPQTFSLLAASCALLFVMCNRRKHS